MAAVVAARSSGAAWRCHAWLCRRCVTGPQHRPPRHSAPGSHATRSSITSGAEASQDAPQSGVSTASPSPTPGLSGVTHDERFMQLALEQAALASAADEVPVGAVLISAAGELLAAAHNETEASKDPTAHAELLCVRQAATALGGWRLLDATLYVTLEPCPMCAGALLQSRVGTVVYGAHNTLLGADGSWISMLTRGQPGCCGSGGSATASTGDAACNDAPAAGPAAAAVQPAKPHPFHPSMQVRRGVLAEECAELMRTFFARRRKEAAAAAAAVAAGGIAKAEGTAAAS